MNWLFGEIFGIVLVASLLGFTLGWWSAVGTGRRNEERLRGIVEGERSATERERRLKRDAEEKARLARLQVVELEDEVGRLTGAAPAEVRRKDGKQVVQAVQEEIESLRDEAAKLRDQVRRLMHRSVDQQNELLAAQEEVERLRDAGGDPEAVFELRTALEEAEGRIETLRVELRGKEAANQQLKQEVGQAGGRLNELARAERTLREARDELFEARRREKHLQESIRRLRRSETEARQKAARLEAELGGGEDA